MSLNAIALRDSPLKHLDWHKIDDDSSRRSSASAIFAGLTVAPASELAARVLTGEVPFE